jgi:hypothetical protein
MPGSLAERRIQTSAPATGTGALTGSRGQRERGPGALAVNAHAQRPEVGGTRAGVRCSEGLGGDASSDAQCLRSWVLLRPPGKEDVAVQAEEVFALLSRLP